MEGWTYTALSVHVVPVTAAGLTTDEPGTGERETMKLGRAVAVAANSAAAKIVQRILSWRFKLGYK